MSLYFQGEQSCHFFSWLNEVGVEKGESSNSCDAENTEQIQPRAWEVERRLLQEERDHARRMSDIYRELLHDIDKVKLDE